MIYVTVILLLFCNQEVKGRRESSSNQRAASDAICHLAADPGPCYEYKERWFFDVRSGKCRIFVFRGCGGNKNRFSTEYECEKSCTPTRCVNVFCSNWFGEYTKCRVPENRIITNFELKKQIGLIDCQRPTPKYAVRQNNIWVWKGCKAIINYCYVPKFPDHLGYIECSSLILDQTRCKIPSGRKLLQVSLYRQISSTSCTKPTRKFKITYDNQFIVMRGCRGIFWYGFVQEGGSCEAVRSIALERNEKMGNNQHVPTCEPDGTYRMEQCDEKMGECWCVDPRTGEMFDGMKKLNKKLSDVKCGLSINLTDTTWDWYDNVHKTGQIRFLKQQRIVWNENGIVQGMWSLDFDILKVAFNNKDYLLKVNIFLGEAVSYSRSLSSSKRNVKLIQKVQITCDQTAAHVNVKANQDVFKPKCTNNGNYKPKQCNDVTRECWCVNPVTGVMIPNTKKQFDDDQIVDCDSWILQEENVCFGTKNGNFGSFWMQESGTYDAFKLVHKHGYVSCKTDMSGRSIWGCGGEKLGVVICNSKSGILFPSKCDRRGYYSLRGYTSHSKTVILENVDNRIIVKKDELLRLWYGEDFKNVQESDNHGQVCADVYARLSTAELPFTHVGCFWVGTLTGVAERVETKSALSVCYYYALTQRSKYFAIKKNFECYSSPSFGEHHTSDQCRYGRGNDNDVDVYEIKEAIGAIGSTNSASSVMTSRSLESTKPREEQGFTIGKNTSRYLGSPMENSSHSLLYASDAITISGEIKLADLPTNLATARSCAIVQLKDTTDKPPVNLQPIVINISGANIGNGIPYQIRTNKLTNENPKRAYNVLVGITMGHCSGVPRFGDGFLKLGDYISKKEHNLVLVKEESSYIQNVVVERYDKKIKEWKRSVAAYWGQDQAGKNGLHAEPSLKDVCTDFNYDIISMQFVQAFVSSLNKDNLPATSLSRHCATAFVGYPELMKCPHIGKDIKKCQAKGKLVTLSLGFIGKLHLFENAKEAQTFAKTIWNLFLGGQSSVRPFGDDVILNGVDINLKGGGAKYQYYGDFVKTIRELMDGDKDQRMFKITASISCNLAYSHIGINIQYLDHLYLKDWTNKMWGTMHDECYFYTMMSNWLKIVGGVKRNHSGEGPDVHLQLSANRRRMEGMVLYFSPSDIEKLIRRMDAVDDLGGVMILDASYDSNNVIDGAYFSSHITRIINSRHLHDDEDDRDFIDTKDIIIIIISIFGFFFSVKIIHWRYKSLVFNIERGNERESAENAMSADAIELENDNSYELNGMRVYTKTDNTDKPKELDRFLISPSAPRFTPYDTLPPPYNLNDPGVYSLEGFKKREKDGKTSSA